MIPHEWHTRALCAHMTNLPEKHPDRADPEWWFSHPDSPEACRAKTMCAQCPVIEECLTDALDNYLDGIWAGTGNLERRIIREKRGYPRRPPGRHPILYSTDTNLSRRNQEQKERVIA